MNTLLSHRTIRFIIHCLLFIIITSSLLFLFSVSLSAKEDKKHLQEQNSQSENQAESNDPNQTKTSLEKTKKAFDSAFNNPGKENIILRELIQKANEEEKNWIKEALINRYNSEPNTKIRLECMTAMVWFREAAAKLYVQALSDTDRSIRRLAAHNLGFVGTEEEVDALYQALKKDRSSSEQDFYFARDVISSIGQIGGTKAARVINEIRLSKELSKGCEDGILGALGSTGDPNVFKTLEDGLKGSEEKIRGNAVYGLGQLASYRDNRKNPELMDKITQLFMSYINDKNPRVRNNIVLAFVIIGERKDIPMLKTMLEDNYSTIVSYTENGEVKKKTRYPIREAAREAIDSINKRLESDI